MALSNFHLKPFDEGTLTKLQIFELYTREWLPVFLSPDKPSRSEIHLFDFFSGPGTDANGELGSPLRILKQLNECCRLAGWNKTRVSVHFFDKSPAKIKQLQSNIESRSLKLSGVAFEIRALKFEDAFSECKPALANSNGSKLVFIDQCGVDHVTPEVFRQLVSFPTCDFLFFLSSSTLHRFRDHPAIMLRGKHFFRLTISAPAKSRPLSGSWSSCCGLASCGMKLMFCAYALNAASNGTTQKWSFPN